MMNITCPFCGKRNESEFVYGGPVVSRRPDPTQTPNEKWVEYLTIVPNPLGPVEERWWHARGCGECFALWRDTLSHDILEEAADAR